MTAPDRPRAVRAALGAAAAVMIGGGVLIAVGGAGAGDDGGEDCLGPSAEARWAVPLGESGAYGDDGLVAATRVGSTVVLRTVATGVDGSDVQGESTDGDLVGVGGGEVVWSRPGLDLVPGLPGDEDGLLAADAGDLVRLDADGRESWRSPGAVVRHEHDGRLVVETAEGAAAVVDADTGETQRELDGGFVGADDDMVLVTADGNGVRLVGLDGSERWVRRPAEVDVSSGVAALFTDGMLALGETGALPTVVGLDLDHGDELWRTEQGLGGTLSLGRRGPDGTLTLDEATDDGAVVTVHDRTGPIGSETVGSDPDDLESRLRERLGDADDLLDDLELADAATCDGAVYALVDDDEGPADEDDADNADDAEDDGTDDGTDEVVVLDQDTARQVGRLVVVGDVLGLRTVDGGLLVEVEVDGEPQVVLFA